MKLGWSTYAVFRGIIFLILLVNSCSVPNKKELSEPEDVQIPEGWGRYNVVILEDEAQYKFERVLSKLVAKIEKSTWYLVQAATDNRLKTFTVYFHRGISKRPTGLITVYYPDGNTWEQELPKKNWKEYKENGIYNSGAEYFTWVIPRYVQGMKVNVKIHYPFDTPERLTLETFRENFPSLKKTIKVVRAEGENIRVGLANHEGLNIDSTQVIQDDTLISVFTARKIPRFPSVLERFPEEWYAALHFSVHPSFNTAPTWENLGDYYLAQINQAFVITKEIEQTIKEVKFRDPDSIISGVFDLIQKRVRYHANEEGLFGWIARPASEIFSQGYGDCKEKSVLMVLMLKQKGIKAGLAIVHTEKHTFQMSMAYPTLGQANHMIVYVMDQSRKIHFYDPTAYYSSAKKSSYWFLGQKALVLEEGMSRLVQVPQHEEDISRIYTRSHFEKNHQGWQLFGSITLTGQLAWDVYSNLYFLSAEGNRPYQSFFLHGEFNLQPRSFSLQKSTLDTIRWEYQQDINAGYVKTGKGGILCNRPSIYASALRMTDSIESPVYLLPFSQDDAWDFPKDFNEKIESHALSPVIDGFWKNIDSTVYRYTKVQGGKALFQPVEFEEIKKLINRQRHIMVWRRE